METLIVWFNEIHWVAVLQIIMIDILLGGDNAVVIALACRDLDPHLRRKGIFYGAGGAIALRVILIAFAVTIMTIPYLKFCGGLLLLWIGIKLIVPHDEGDQEVHASKKLWGAVKTIIIADLVMSIDNVIAIAGAAEQAPGHHQMALVIFGLLVSVPFILGGSQFILKILDRFPIIVYAGGALLGWIAGTLMVDDPGISPHFPNLPELHMEGGIAGIVFVLGVALLIKFFKSRKSS
ncbi:TerC family protein [Parasutterella muris]|uniref:YjbE family putative metal transport protein n=3 Tax=Parasutterella TaxID=577310 RepID=A0A6L6YLX5_9BURK|nr:TerC family protein [Parasutterella muris]MVX57889.1 YjbE family putative metal transport protein [Parasutterella muris]